MEKNTKQNQNPHPNGIVLFTVQTHLFSNKYDTQAWYKS